MFKNRFLFQAVLLAVCVIGGILLGMKISPVAGEAAHISPAETVSTPTDKHASHAHAKESPNQSTAADWCAEHRYPESECTVCQPELIAKFQADGNWCAVHNAPESNCRQCNPTLLFPQEPQEPITAEPVKTSVFLRANQVGCTSEQAVVRFATAMTADRIGLRVEPVLHADALSSLEAPAEVVLDETRVRAIAVSVPATITRWLVEPGEFVTTGQPLAELQSPEMASLKSQYLTAVADWTRDHQQWKRATELRLNQMISQAEMDDFEAAEKTALSHLRGLEAQLKSLGLSRQDLDSLSVRHNADGNWLLRSDHSAAVIERRAVLGQRLDAGSTLALIGDPTALWIQAHVREQDLSRFKIGQEIEFTADGESLARSQGKVIWVSQYLEPETRTGIVRARVSSGSDQLRAHTFGRALLRSVNDQEALLVPKDAVQWEGCCNIVFVQEAIDRYRPTKVTVDRGNNHHYRVESGLREGDLVVTTGSFLLKTELKKESLGVGCAGE
jgi:cobalt-zinc-cadmium efflux system membrane fusion protein